MKLPLVWTKMSGTQNSFLITNGMGYRFQDLKRSERMRLAKELCSAKHDIHADGLIFLEEPQDLKNNFSWDFYNSDGSSAEMCGNAARCVSLYYHDRIKKIDQVSFETESGLVQGKIEDVRNVMVTMPAYKILASHKKIRSTSFEFEFSFINSGVPHLVLELKSDIPPAQLLSIAKEFRHHAELGSAGANITFFKKLSSASIRALSFERGVENFTQSCGTGAVAAALAFAPSGNNIVQVMVPGGQLEVKLENGQAFLRGPAQFHYDISFDSSELIGDKK